MFFPNHDVSWLSGGGVVPARACPRCRSSYISPLQQKLQRALTNVGSGGDYRASSIGSPGSAAPPVRTIPIASLATHPLRFGRRPGVPGEGETGGEDGIPASAPASCVIAEESPTSYLSKQIPIASLTSWIRMPPVHWAS